MRTHAEIKELLAIHDRLADDELVEVNAHVAGCAECAGELAAWQRMDRGLRHMPDPAPSAHLRERLPLPRPQPVAHGEPPRVRPAPPPHALATEAEAERAGAVVKSFPWPRLFLPVGLALLFIASIWLGMRDTSRGPALRVTTPDLPPAVVATPEPPTIDATGHVTITFACDDVAAVYKDYATIARAFEAENPDISITLKSYRDILESSFSTVYGSDDEAFIEGMREISRRADVFCAWSVPELAQRRIIRDLSSLINSDPSFDLSDYYDVVLDYGKVADAIYGLPGRFQPTVIRYDPAAFDEAGLAYPQPGWTWDDFRAAAVALTQREGGNTQRWGFGEDRAAVFRARLAEALRAGIFEAAVSNNASIFVDPGVLELLAWYEALYVNDRAAFPPRGDSGTEAGYTPNDVYRSQIARGKLAMWTDQLYEGALREGRVAPFPADDVANGGTPVVVEMLWVMSEEAQHTDAAWRWLSYLSRNLPPDPQQMLPARKSLVEQATFWRDLPAEEAAAYRYILDHLAPWPSFTDEQQGLYEILGAVARAELSLAELQAIAEGRDLPTPPSVIGTSTITFAAPRNDLVAYREAAAAFNAQSGNVFVEVVAREDLIDPGRAETTTLWAEMRQIARRVDALAGPEVAALVRSGRAEGALYDLTESMGDLSTESFYPNTLESLRWRGTQWALPDRVSPYVIYYNQWMFDQMGVVYPQAGWTWDDFIRTAQAVTRQGEDKTSWWGVKDGPGNQLLILAAMTAPLVDYGATPAQPLLDQPALLRGAQRYGDLLRAGFLAVPDILLPEVGSQTPLLDGVEAPNDAAMWIGLADLEKLDDLQRGGIGAVPLPVTNPAGDTPIQIHNAFAVSANSADPAGAWAWIHFLTTYGTTDSRGPGLSAQRTVLLSADTFERYALDVYQAALDRGQRAAPLRAEEYLAQRALWAAITGIAQGEDAKTVLLDAQAQAEAAINQ